MKIENFITSASGWRRVFAEDKDEESKTEKIGFENQMIALFSGIAFAKYIKNLPGQINPAKILVGRDTRPTGKEICSFLMKGLLSEGLSVSYSEITAAPEIMADCHNYSGFVYVSASHNPIGHNGIKFGLNDGGVLCGSENAKIVKIFYDLIEASSSENQFSKITSDATLSEKLLDVYENSPAVKKSSVNFYEKFSKSVISGFNLEAIDFAEKTSAFFEELKSFAEKNKIGIVCDFNGSARTLSIDKKIFSDLNINFYSINNKPGQIVHTIIPEPENLVFVANEMERLQKEGKTDAILGYMPDCDGDRGNIVFWDKTEKKAKVLKAQEVFALSVYSELKAAKLRGEKKLAVAVNGPTSMRIEEIAENPSINAKVFRAEVGEANVVNLARKLRTEGYVVPILGEGSNGGNITHPAAVRDPLNTVFALIKLLKMENENSNSSKSLSDILDSLPKYTTTGVSENRAILKIKTSDHGILKANFQKIFEDNWKNKKSEKIVSLFAKYGIQYYKSVSYNGTETTFDLEKVEGGFSFSGKGGLKIIFYNEENIPAAFIWMRGSGTEPVFRVMAECRGTDCYFESALLDWEREMILSADEIGS